MMKFLFDIGYFISNFIPGKNNRTCFRRTQLYDYRKKLNSLKTAFPNLNFHNVRLVKGGWNIGFIVDNKYVFKIRKLYSDDKKSAQKIIREKRITDAFSNIVNIAIPNIEIFNVCEYVFYRYEFIPGKNLNEFSARKIKKNREKIGKSLGDFIYKMHNAQPPEIADLAVPVKKNADGWNHNDLCNNILIDPKTMTVSGIIDWEYAGFGALATEFENAVIFKKKIKESGILTCIKNEYFAKKKND